MTSVTLVRRIKARPTIVFEALTAPEGILQWWGCDEGPVLIAETDVRVGGRFRVRFRVPSGEEHESAGEYLEVVAPTRLVMSWRWTAGGVNDESGETSQVEIDLKSVDVGTELTLTHSRLKTDASRASHQRGWTGSLDKLVRLFERAQRPAVPA